MEENIKHQQSQQDLALQLKGLRKVFDKASR